MAVEKIPIDPTYRRDNGTWALNTQTVVPEGFTVYEQAIVWLPPGKTAGNHRHRRREVLLGLGEGACFRWEDPDGSVHEEVMNPDGMLYLFVIPSQIPHAVINRSTYAPVCLYEYFDDAYAGVERVVLVRDLEGS